MDGWLDAGGYEWIEANMGPYGCTILGGYARMNARLITCLLPGTSITGPGSQVPGTGSWDAKTCGPGPWARGATLCLGLRLSF